ncbi:aminotransferase [Thamnocephalis sphaerospora]|uniref:Branched-chain-amino-acid aminotransferase n=1 Tax=Thamnocephalis sphaerospora TaxID=78915 RepID=A0A4P9XIH0_9FUNG|nr:aminotransferase [Thamnocephalis sphaerospora]|eukprot:RKP05492.1 aminotransferase [Thamnocephalis sphaerospora]
MAFSLARLARQPALTPRALVGLARRSLQSEAAPALRPLSAGHLEHHLTDKPRALTPNKDLVFGHTFSDHMLQVEWTADAGWGNPRIQPYGKISLEPSAVVFHYAFECFEGMKAYKDAKGHARLFRPDLNMNRLLRSTGRVALPSFEKDQLLECIKELVRTEKRWIPSGKGYSLYIRPTVIGTQETLGVAPSNRALLFVICSPVGPYYRTGFNAISLNANAESVRAWPGGTGDFKIGSNYAPTVKIQLEAAKRGLQQNLWLFGKDHQITEVGTMNCFVLLKNEQGETELVTPELDGCILPGVTRDSILGLAREWNEFKVSERKITMGEVKRAAQDGRLIEMFGAGTACIVSPIKRIQYMGEDIMVPLDPSDPTCQAGPITRRLNDELLAIQYGEIEHPWSVVID